MEERTQVKDLINTIKKEGIEEAEKEKESIIQNAQTKAEEIVEQEKKESIKIINNAKEESEKLTVAGNKALSQAGRNLLINIRQEIVNLFQKVTLRKTSSSLSSDAVKDVILKIVEKWDVKENFPGIEVLVNNDDLKNLEESLFQALNDKWKEGVTIKPLEGIQAGFRIGEKDGNVHYNFTDKGVSEILSEYLNPKLAKFLESNEKENMDNKEN